MGKGLVGGSLTGSFSSKKISVTERRVLVETFVPFVGEVGFPIVVSFYLLNRMEKKLDVVIASIREMKGQL